MFEFTRLMVGLDLTDTDQSLIRYTEFISQIIRPEKIYFIHIHNNLDLPEEVRQEIYGSNEPLDEYLREEMKEQVNQYFSNHTQFEVEFLIVEGSPLPLMLHWSKIKEINLLLLGRKNTRGSGTFLTRMTRRAHCSVLIVPSLSEITLDNVLVCNDFSESSRMALNQAIFLAKLTGYTTVYSQHIYEVPMGYHKTGKSFDEFARIMKKHAFTRYHEMVDALDKGAVDLNVIFTLDRKNDSASHVAKAADSIQASLVVVGAKGRTFAASIFMGSFSERLVREECNFPLLVTKRKDEVLDVFEAIKSL